MPSAAISALADVEALDDPPGGEATVRELDCDDDSSQRRSSSTRGSVANPAAEEVILGAAEAGGGAAVAQEGGSSGRALKGGKKRASLGRRGEVMVPARPGLSEQCVQDLREIFGLFDIEMTGLVSPNAIRAAAADAGLERDSPDIWAMLAGLDGEEPVNFEEFISLVTEPLGDNCTKSGASRLLGLFGASAVTLGSFCAADMRRLIDDLGLDMDDEQISDMLDKAGAGDDGRLGFDEFYAAVCGPASEDVASS